MHCTNVPGSKARGIKPREKRDEISSKGATRGPGVRKTGEARLSRPPTLDERTFAVQFSESN